MGVATHWAANHVPGRACNYPRLGAGGPLVGYSDTWQLVINTATTIITFLMVFVIQNTQNRDTAAMHIKIGCLVRRVNRRRF